ncbi:hypothetical protein PINS_up004191 [Pythium insidiosum]|nr:hypothetical protein PINS_up004191 [Pythium insidiosum]
MVPTECDPGISSGARLETLDDDPPSIWVLDDETYWSRFYRPSETLPPSSPSTQPSSPLPSPPPPRTTKPTPPTEEPGTPTDAPVMLTTSPSSTPGTRPTAVVPITALPAPTPTSAPAPPSTTPSLPSPAPEVTTTPTSPPTEALVTSTQTSTPTPTPTSGRTASSTPTPSPTPTVIAISPRRTEAPVTPSDATATAMSVTATPVPTPTSTPTPTLTFASTPSSASTPSPTPDVSTTSPQPREAPVTPLPLSSPSSSPIVTGTVIDSPPPRSSRTRSDINVPTQSTSLPLPTIIPSYHRINSSTPGLRGPVVVGALVMAVWALCCLRLLKQRRSSRREKMAIKIAAFIDGGDLMPRDSVTCDGRQRPCPHHRVLINKSTWTKKPIRKIPQSSLSGRASLVPAAATWWHTHRSQAQRTS